MNENLAIQRRLIWRQKFKEKVCVRVFGKKECVTAELELKIFQDGGTFTIEIRLGSFGTWTETLKLGCLNKSAGPLSAEVCIADLVITNGKLISLRITAELCIGIKILGIKIKECWKVLDSRIVLFTSKDISTQTGDISTMEERILEEIDISGNQEVYVQIDSGIIIN
ncbi:hypothetical protein [Corallibacter sp.]|uniref:hypothetical protein n=1 Tax=Corallibacter sp. TaxID=2038084 RepID=UPI003AB68689